MSQGLGTDELERDENDVIEDENEIARKLGMQSLEQLKKLVE